MSDIAQYTRPQEENPFETRQLRICMVRFISRKDDPYRINNRTYMIFVYDTSDVREFVEQEVEDGIEKINDLYLIHLQIFPMKRAIFAQMEVQGGISVTVDGVSATEDDVEVHTGYILLPRHPEDVEYENEE
jgi:hypothetical protein